MEKKFSNNLLNNIKKLSNNICYNKYSVKNNLTFQILFKNLNNYKINKKNFSVKKNYNKTIKKIINKNLKKYNITPIKFNKKIVNGLIFDGKSHLISLFKDYLFWYDEIECLKRFYYKNEVKSKIKTFINYYLNSYYKILFYNIYLRLGDCQNVLKNYYKLKTKLQNEIRNSQNNNNQKININDNNKIEEKIINTHLRFNSNSLILSKITPEEMIINYDDFQQKDENLNIDYLDNKNLSTKKNKEKKYKLRNIIKLNLSYDETIKSLIQNLSKKKINKTKTKKILNQNNINYIKRNNNNNLKDFQLFKFDILRKTNYKKISSIKINNINKVNNRTNNNIKSNLSSKRKYKLKFIDDSNTSNNLELKKKLMLNKLKIPLILNTYSNINSERNSGKNSIKKINNINLLTNKNRNKLKFGKSLGNILKNKKHFYTQRNSPFSKIINSYVNNIYKS